MIKEILLAEDDRGTAYLVKVQLERHGYNVTVVGNGIEALQMIRTQPVDLLITDVVMPEMDGVDLYLELKKDERNAKLPIIIVTDKQMFKDSFSALGVDHFVPKASDISLLLAKINEVSRTVLSPRAYRKVLIAGAQSATVEEIRGLLASRDCLVTTVERLTDLASRVFLMTPHLILLDAGMQDVVTPSELVLSFRTFHFLKSTKILTYVQLSPDVTGGGGGASNVQENEVRACLQAGADRHLGRYNRTVFEKAVEEMGMVVRNGV